MTRKKDKAKSKTLALMDQDEGKAWDFLERALEENGYLFPTSVESIASEDKSNLNLKIKSLKLPNDVNEVLKRGEEIARRGLVRNQDIKVDKEVNKAFAAAARNGTGISKEVLDRMHADRKLAENKEEK